MGFNGVILLGMGNHVMKVCEICGGTGSAKEPVRYGRHKRCRLQEPCLAEGCEKIGVHRGYCKVHYGDFRRANPELIRRYKGAGNYCTVNGCSDPMESSGLCRMHAQRMRARGEVGSAEPMIYKLLNDEDRFWKRVQKTESCWHWTGYLDGAGYGKFRGRERVAHRMAFVLAKGPIPEGMTIHHVCANRRCVNPSHLVLATRQENIAEMRARKSYEALIAHLESENARLRARIEVLEADRLRATA